MINTKDPFDQDYSFEQELTYPTTESGAPAPPKKSRSPKWDKFGVVQTVPLLVTRKDHKGETFARYIRGVPGKTLKEGEAVIRQYYGGWKDVYDMKLVSNDKENRLELTLQWRKQI